jgi:hypothetical protein
MQKDPEISNRIKEAVSILFALGLVSLMQYFVARECCQSVPDVPQAHLPPYTQLK